MQYSHSLNVDTLSFSNSLAWLICLIRLFDSSTCSIRFADKDLRLRMPTISARVSHCSRTNSHTTSRACANQKPEPWWLSANSRTLFASTIGSVFTFSSSCQSGEQFSVCLSFRLAIFWFLDIWKFEFQSDPKFSIVFLTFWFTFLVYRSVLQFSNCFSLTYLNRLALESPEQKGSKKASEKLQEVYTRFSATYT